MTAARRQISVGRFVVLPSHHTPVGQTNLDKLDKLDQFRRSAP
ncbi:hypothetical protein [Streptomyces sp. NPDC002758]